MGAGFDFSGEKVLVTGASRGIGRGIAEAFAAAGADLTILADDAGIDTAAAELSAKHGGKITALRCDIADRAAVKDALASLDRIDVLVNNAGLERIHTHRRARPRGRGDLRPYHLDQHPRQLLRHP